MSSEVKRPVRAVPQAKDTELDELRTAVQGIQEQMMRLNTGLPNAQVVDKQIKTVWTAIEELQKYREEDNNDMGNVVDDIMVRHEQILESLSSLKDELDKAVRRGSIVTRGSDREEISSDEDLLSILGIEAPKKTWIMIFKVLAGIAIVAGGAYVAYRYSKGTKSVPFVPM